MSHMETAPPDRTLVIEGVRATDGEQKSEQILTGVEKLCNALKDDFVLFCACVVPGRYQPTSMPLCCLIPCLLKRANLFDHHHPTTSLRTFVTLVICGVFNKQTNPTHMFDLV